MEGYDCEFVEPPPDELICLICMFVARQPHQLDCCGRVFCKTCLDQNNARAYPCPNCRGTGKAFVDRRGERNILSLKVKCTNAGKGCRWQEELRSLDSHLGVCGFALVVCPNKCTQDGNELQQVLRKDLKHHMQVECSNRMYTCPHCGSKGRYTKMTTSHLDRCPQLKGGVPCPNGCGERVKKSDLQKHRSVCPNEEVKCKYAEVGCEVKGPRKEMNLHEVNKKDLHLHRAMETIGKLKQQQVVLNPANQLVFKMAHFSHYKACEEQWYSAPFYSHPRGYKMCIGVDANGSNDGEGTHVSVWVHLMRGENDDYLMWPFQGTIQVQLLNQLQDKHHYTKLVTYDEEEEDDYDDDDYDDDDYYGDDDYYDDDDNNDNDDDYYDDNNDDDNDDSDDDLGCRVISGNIDNGNGWDQFIHHNALHIDYNRHCHYLKDDCLYFRIESQNIEFKTSKPRHKNPWPPTCIT